jgi:hypothetical protein
MKIHNIKDFINCESEFFQILKSVPRISAAGPWVAGGSVWKSIEGKPLTCDIDFFFQSSKQCEYWYRTMLSIPYTHRIVSEPKSNSYNTSFKYCVKCGDRNKLFTIQLVSFKFFPDIQTMLNDFDFTACQFGYDGINLYTGDTSLDDVRNREIIYNKISDSYATSRHVRKYTDIGFKISEQQQRIFNEFYSKEKATKAPKTVRIRPFESLLTRTPSLDALVGQSTPTPSPAPASPVLGEYVGDTPILVESLIPIGEEDDNYPEPVIGSDSVDLSRITNGGGLEPSLATVPTVTFRTVPNNIYSFT